MLSVSVIIGAILAGVLIAKSLKAFNIMPDVESFILKTGLLGAFVGVALLQVIEVMANNATMTLFTTFAIIYIGFCAIYDMIENYRKNRTNKSAAVKSILIG